MTSLLSDRATPQGKWAFVVSLLLVFSVSIDYRLRVAGLLVHPYLLLLPMAILLNNINVFEIPPHVFKPFAFFFVIFSFASLRNEDPFSEIFKVFASLLTYLFFVVTIKTEKDFRTVCWGFIFCGLTIGIRSFIIKDTEGVSRLSGINALEGLGNKNAQSLYTLPAIFFGIILWLKYLSEKKMMRLFILTAVLFFILVSVFISANRSGYLGLAIIGVVFMIYSGASARTIVLATVFSFMGYIAVEKYAIDIVEHKREQTIKGFASDVGRQRLAIQSFSVGLENPILGVGKDELHKQMAFRLGVSRYGMGSIDSHILWGYLFGATGIFSLLAFLFFLKSMTMKYPIQRRNNHLSKAANNTWVLVSGFVILFFVRSLFTRETLYSPTFMGGLGLIFGYYFYCLKRARSIIGY